MTSTASTLRRLVPGLALSAALVVLAGCTGLTPTQSSPPASAPSQPSASAPAESGDDDAAVEQGDDEVVTIGLKFMPETITVPVGTTVTWRNGETIGHTITSGAFGDVNEATGLRGTQTADDMFRHALAPMGQEGDTFSFTFDEPGEYPYFCEPHLTMNAFVIVE